MNGPLVPRILAAALLLVAVACTQPAPDAPDAPAPAAPPAAASQPTAAPSPAPPSPWFTHGVAAGDMTGDSAVLWTRTQTEAEVVAELSESPAFDRVTALPAVRSSAARDFTVKVTAQSLRPGTQYHYRFRAGSDVSPTGTFTTAFAPTQNARVTLAFSGDADWKWKPYPILNTLTNERLDFFLFLGDVIYETTNYQGAAAAETLDDYRTKYRENREPRPNSASRMTPMLDLYRRFGQYSVFDNHETGPSRADRNAPPYTDGGALVDGVYVNQTPGHRARLQAFSEYQPVREEQVTGTGDPRSDGTGKFYKAVSWGQNVELIVLDARSYRDRQLRSSDAPEAASCGRTMLGAPQLKWAQDALLAAKARGAVWKLVVTASPIQEQGRASELGYDFDGNKSWAGGYRCERDRLLKFLDDNAIENVVFLTTDNHHTVINDLTYHRVPGDLTSPRAPARNAFEIITGPLGAGAGNPIGLKVETTGLPIREADRKIVATWNGDLPNTAGETRGLKQAGLDPLGLEPDFPGLIAASVKATGVAAGTVEPTAFVSFNTYTYAVLTADAATLTVTVKGFPIVPRPETLDEAAALAEYEARQAQEILSFQVRAR